MRGSGYSEEEQKKNLGESGEVEDFQLCSVSAIEAAMQTSPQFDGSNRDFLQDFNPQYHNFVFKVVRAGRSVHCRDKPYNYIINSFLEEITKSSLYFDLPTQNEEKRKPQKGQYTVQTGIGVVKRTEKKPQYSKGYKMLHSKSQYTTFVSPKNNYFPAFFGFGRSKAGSGVFSGFIFSTDLDKSVLMKNFLHYDRSTYDRPFDHDNVEDASRWLAKAKKDGYWHEDLNSLVNAGIEARSYNEVLARLRALPNRTCMGCYFEDNLVSKILTQLRVSDLRHRFLQIESRDENSQVSGIVDATRLSTGRGLVSVNAIPIAAYIPRIDTMTSRFRKKVTGVARADISVLRPEQQGEIIRQCFADSTPIFEKAVAQCVLLISDAPYLQSLDDGKGPFSFDSTAISQGDLREIIKVAALHLSTRCQLHLLNTLVLHGEVNFQDIAFFGWELSRAHMDILIQYGATTFRECFFSSNALPTNINNMTLLNCYVEQPSDQDNTNRYYHIQDTKMDVKILD